MSAKAFLVIAFLTSLVAARSSLAYDWQIDRDDEDVKMRPRYDYDPSHQYRGTIEDDGDVRMRSRDGSRIRGNVDEDGYGRLRDDDGNTWRVRPR